MTHAGGGPPEASTPAGPPVGPARAKLGADYPMKTTTTRSRMMTMIPARTQW